MLMERTGDLPFYVEVKKFKVAKIACQAMLRLINLKLLKLHA